jgi:hypothetical protein
MNVLAEVPKIDSGEARVRVERRISTKKHCEKHMRYYNYCSGCRIINGFGIKRKSLFGEVRNRPLMSKEETLREIKILERKLEELKVIPPNVSPGDYDYKKGQGPKTVLAQKTGEIGFRVKYGRLGRSRTPVRIYERVIFVRHPKGLNSKLCWDTIDKIENAIESGLPFIEALGACAVPKELWEIWKEKDLTGNPKYSGVVERIENAIRRQKSMIAARLKTAFFDNPNTDAGRKYLDLCGVAEEKETGIRKIEFVLVDGKGRPALSEGTVVDVEANESGNGTTEADNPEGGSPSGSNDKEVP